MLFFYVVVVPLQGLVQEVTGKMSDVQQLTQVGRELVDLSETGQLENLEDRLTRINNAWEDLSSAAEQRMLTLPKYKAKLADFEKSVDQMNQWLEDMEKETNKVRPKDEEADVAKNKIDVSFYWIMCLNTLSILQIECIPRGYRVYEQQNFVLIRNSYKGV